MIGTHHGAIGAILARQPLDDLIGLFALSRVDHLHAGPMLPMFNGISLLPAVEDDRQRMAFAMSIGRQSCNKDSLAISDFAAD